MARSAYDITVSLSEVAALAAVEQRPGPRLRVVSEPPPKPPKPRAMTCTPATPRPGPSAWSTHLSKRVRAWADRLAPAPKRPDPRPTCRSCGQGVVSTIGSEDRNGYRLTRGRCVKCRADWALQHDGSQLLAPW